MKAYTKLLGNEELSKPLTVKEGSDRMKMFYNMGHDEPRNRKERRALKKADSTGKAVVIVVPEKYG